MVLVDIESTYTAPSATIIQRAQRLFPTLSIILISPRIDGFPRAYAAFELDQLIAHINADTIAWAVHGLPPANGELPF